MIQSPTELADAIAELETYDDDAAAAVRELVAALDLDEIAAQALH